VATFSNYLGLKLNQSSDPFLLSDFVANWEILDAAPGTYICTSTTRPSWSSGQAGRLIYMTDLKQLSYWSGSAWADLRDSVPTFAQGAIVNSSMSPGSSPQFNVLSFTTPRPCSMAIFATGTYQCSNQRNQDAYQSIIFDGAKQNMGSYREQIRFSGNSSDSGNTAGLNVPSLTVVPTVTAGSHTVGLQVDMTSDYSNSVTLYGVKIVGMIALYSSGNSL
jgi:hypothetical protein